MRHLPDDYRPEYEGQCNVCGGGMTNVGTELRCERWPECRGKRALPLHIVLDAGNAKRLPGL